MVENDLRINVLHVILTLERAGAQEVVRSLCKELDRLGCHSVVCTFADGPVRGDLEALGITVEVLGARRHGIEFLPLFLSEMIGIRRELARLVAQHDIHVLVTHVLQTVDFVTPSLLRSTRLKGLVWTVQNFDFLPNGRAGWSRLKRKAHAWIYRSMARKPYRWVAVSEMVRDAVIREIGPIDDLITIIPNGVDESRFEQPGDKPALCGDLRIDPSSLLIATVGRLTEQKGHCFLVDAARSIVDAHPEAHFLLIGDGELRKGLERQVTRARLARHFHFLGVRDDVPHLLASSDIFVLPSLWEGLSVALLEAMAAARPVVATAVSGTVEVIVNDETGLLVPPGDSDALAAAVGRLLCDPAKTSELGRKARQMVSEKYSARRQALAYLELLREGVSNERG